jgi:hypothetical protein
MREEVAKLELCKVRVCGPFSKIREECVKSSKFLLKVT